MTLPPFVVIVWDKGVMLTVGAAAVQVGTLSVVTTLLFALVCPVAVAVTVVVSVPLVCPVLLLNVSVIAALVAPGARVTDAELRVDALKAVVLLSDLASVYVTFEQTAVSLFLTVTE